MVTAVTVYVPLSAASTSLTVIESLTIKLCGINVVRVATFPVLAFLIISDLF